MNEVMAEIAQLSSQETKAINLRAAASSQTSPYLTSLKTRDRQQSVLEQPQLPALLCFLHSLQPAGIKTGQGTFYCKKASQETPVSTTRIRICL